MWDYTYRYAYAFDVCNHGTAQLTFTDIQPSNIMIQVPDEKLILDHLSEVPAPTTSSAAPDEPYMIIPSSDLRDVYFPEEGFNMMTLSICLSDWGVASFKDRHLSEFIQPVLLRAPEVILEAPWSTAVDVWNLGALVPELMYRQNMFSAHDAKTSMYSTKVHLQEIAALLGPFPPSLIEQAHLEDVMSVFGLDGQPLDDATAKNTVSLQQRFASLPANEAVKFEDLVRAMLTIDPGQRKTAAELLEHPWLKHEYVEDLHYD